MFVWEVRQIFIFDYSVQVFVISMNVIFLLYQTFQNANHPDSQAIMPNIPVITLQQSQLASQQQQQQQQQLSTISHIGTLTSFSSTNNNSNKNNQVATTQNNSNNGSNSNNNNNQYYSTASTHKPTGGFRIRLHWQQGYNWQNNHKEQLYCMECRGSCRSGSSIQVDKCNTSSNNIRQKFIAIAKTIRPASNPALCLTSTGYSGTSDPVKLRHCNRGLNQNFMEVRSDEKFELQPEGGSGKYCLSQHHHPKDHEVVFPEECEKTRRFDTTYWKLF